MPIDLDEILGEGSGVATGGGGVDLDAILSEPLQAPAAAAPTLREPFGPPKPANLPEEYGPPDLPRLQPLEPEVYRDTRTPEQMPNAALSQREMIGRVTNTAMDDAAAGFDPSLSQNLTAKTEQEAMSDAQMASRQMYGTPDKWQQFYVAPESKQAAPRQMANPEEQALYDKVRRQVMTDLGMAKDERRYALQQELEAEQDYANTPGMRAVGNVPVAREIGAGLASAGLSIGSIPYAVKDVLTGSEDSKAIAQERGRLRSATLRAGQEDAAPERVRGALMGATESLATSALGGRLGPSGAVGAGAATSAAGAVGEGQQAGLSRTQTAVNALSQGVLEAALELGAQRLGLGGIEDILGGAATGAKKEAFLSFLTKTYGKELLTEIPTTELQNAAATFISEGKLAKAEGRFDRLIDTALQTAIASGAVAPFQRIASKEGPPSRSDLRELGINEPTSLAEREALKEQIQQKLLKAQPELSQADPNKTVGAQYNEPLRQKPPEQGMSPEEFDKVVAEHSRSVRNQLPSEFEISEEQPDSPTRDMGAAKEAFIQYGMENFKQTREEMEASWEKLQSEKKPEVTQQPEPSVPVQVKQSELADINPQDFEQEQTPQSINEPLPQVQRVPPKQAPSGMAEQEAPKPRGGTIQAMAAGSGVLPIGQGKQPVKAVSKYRDIIPAIQRDILGAAPQQIGKVAVPGVKGVRGYYKRYQEVVRIGGKDAGSLHVVAHEAAHHMDKVNNAVSSAPQNIKDELAKMDYEPTAARPSEGFAEFVYDYYANDGQRNPTVKQWFEQEFLPKNPALQKSVAKIKNLVEGYIGQDVQQRVQADRSKTGESVDTTPTQTFVRNVETKLAHLITDRLAGLEKAEFAALRQLGKSVSESKLYQLAMHYSTNKRVVGYDHFTKGAMNIETGERIGPGMETVYETLGDVSDERINSLMDYAEAMRSLDHIKRGRATSMTKSDAQEIATRFKDDQKIKDAHRLLVEHSVGNVKMASEAGLISPEEADAIIASEPNYVPFKRVMEFDAFEQAVSKGGAPFMEFTGSSRQLKDIQAAILDNDARAANAAQKAHLIHSIAKFAEDNEGLGWLATEVEGAKEPHTYRIYRHGQYRNYRVDPAVFAALEGGMSMKNPDEFLGAVSNVLRTFATVKRLGATALNASFQLIANPARDIKGGLIRTEGFAPRQALRSVLAIPRAAMDAYRQVMGKKGADDFELARSLAVQMSGTGVDFESMVYDARKLQQQMQGKGYKAAISSPLQTATDVLGFMEMAPRVAEIAAMMDKFGYTIEDLKNGKPMPAVVRAKIGEAGRNVTLHFPRGGTATKAVNLWSAFTNVMVQGPSQALRTSGFKGWDPRNWDGKAAAKTFVRGSTLLTMPMIAMWLKNKDDEEYQKLEPYEKMFFWNFKIGNQRIKIPRVDGYSMIFAGIPEMALNGLSGRDDRAAKDAIKVLEDSIPDMGSFAPDIAKPIMELNANKDFRGRPIVGRGLEGFLPEEQHDEYTTEFAKSLGAFMGWSPKKIDYALKAYTGGGATTVGKLFEQGATPDALGLSRFDPRVERSKSIEDFYEDMKTAEQNKNSADAKLQKAIKEFSRDGSEANKQKVREAEKALEEKTPDYKLKSEIGSLITDIRKASAGYDKEGKKMVSRYISGLSDVALGNKITKAYPIPVGKYVPAEVRSVAVKFLATKLASISTKNNTTDKEYEEYEKMGYTSSEAKALDAKRVEDRRKFNVDLIKKMTPSKEALKEVVGEYLKKRGLTADEKNIQTHIGLLGLD